MASSLPKANIFNACMAPHEAERWFEPRILKTKKSTILLGLKNVLHFQHGITLLQGIETLCCCCDNQIHHSCTVHLQAHCAYAC